MDTLQSQIEDIEASFCTELLDSNQAVEEAQIALNREKRRLCEAFITAASDLREKIIDTPSVFKETKARHKITEFIVNQAIALRVSKNMEQMIKELQDIDGSISKPKFIQYKGGGFSPTRRDLPRLITTLIAYAQLASDKLDVGAPTFE